MEQPPDGYPDDERDDRPVDDAHPGEHGDVGDSEEGKNLRDEGEDDDDGNRAHETDQRDGRRQQSLGNALEPLRHAERGVERHAQAVDNPGRRVHRDDEADEGRDRDRAAGRPLDDAHDRVDERAQRRSPIRSPGNELGENAADVVRGDEQADDAADDDRGRGNRQGHEVGQASGSERAAVERESPGDREAVGHQGTGSFAHSDILALGVHGALAGADSLCPHSPS